MSDTELSISRELNGLLRARQVTVAVAEGSSGGRIGERLARYTGATAFFKGSVVTYDYPSRTSLLGLPHDELREHGSVSEWAVRKMAEGVRNRFGADIGLASSGTTGPTGRNVGHLWLAVASQGGTLTQGHQLASASRLALQGEFTRLALRFLRQFLAG
jgi:PncC family amidohydrolase